MGGGGRYPKASWFWVFICIILKAGYVFSLYVLLRHMVQGKCIILQNTGEMFGTRERGGSGRFCVPTETVSGRGSEVFLHGLRGWWPTSFNQGLPGAPGQVSLCFNWCSFAYRYWRLFRNLSTHPKLRYPRFLEAPKCSGTRVSLKASWDVRWALSNHGREVPKSIQRQRCFQGIFLNKTTVQSFLGQQGSRLSGAIGRRQQ